MASAKQSRIMFLSIRLRLKDSARKWMLGWGLEKRVMCYMVVKDRSKEMNCQSNLFREKLNTGIIEGMNWHSKVHCLLINQSLVTSLDPLGVPAFLHVSIWGFTPSQFIPRASIADVLSQPLASHRNTQGVLWHQGCDALCLCLYSPSLWHSLLLVNNHLANPSR